MEDKVSRLRDSQQMASVEGDVADARRKAREAVDKMPRLSLEWLRPCMLCGKGLMHDRALNFYRVAVESYLPDFEALQQLHGMETYFTSCTPESSNPKQQALREHAIRIARVMSPVDHFALQIGGTKMGMVCMDCLYLHALGPRLEREERDEHGTGEGTVLPEPQGSPVRAQEEPSGYLRLLWAAGRSFRAWWHIH